MKKDKDISIKVNNGLVYVDKSKTNDINRKATKKIVEEHTKQISNEVREEHTKLADTFGKKIDSLSQNLEKNFNGKIQQVNNTIEDILSAVEPRDSKTNSDGNFKFTFDSKKKCYSINAIIKQPKNIIIPSFYNNASVIEIQAGVFEKKDIVSVDMGKNLNLIGQSAFENCKKLVNVFLPSSLKYIQKNAFANCSKLTNVYYEGTIKDWCNIEFENEYSNPMAYASHFYLKNDKNEWEELTELVIPEETEIYNYQFCGFENVTSLVLPSKIQNIEFTAFKNCCKIIKVTTSHIWLLENLFPCDQIQEIILNNHSYVCYSHLFKNLKKIVLPKCFIGGFYPCTETAGTVEVYYDGTIKDWCKIPFDDDSDADNSMVYADHFYLKNDKNEWEELTELVIPEGIEEIGDYQFQGCDTTLIFIPKSVVKIGYDAFDRCLKLTNVYYEGTIKDWCNIEFENEYSNPMLYAGHFYLKNDKNEWKELTELVLPEGIEEIGYYQFCGFNNVTSITIPNSVTSIGEEAFWNCFSLVEIYNLSNLNITAGSSDNGYVGEHAKVIHTSLTEESRLIEKNNYVFIKDYNNQYYLVSYKGTELVLPSDIEGYNYKINQFDFFGCSNLQYNEYDNGYYLGNSDNPYLALIKAKNKEIAECIINERTRSICQFAFYKCSGLTSITIPNSVTSIGEFAFEYCSSLTNVYYEGTIKDWCNIEFENEYSNPMAYASHFYLKNDKNEWEELTELVIPEGIEGIGDYAFYKCSSLTNVYYEGTIKDWCNIEFENKYSNPMSCADHFYLKNDKNEWEELKELVIPEGIEGIGDYAFYKCSSLTSITIPNSVTSIGEFAFEYCSSLTSITIPNSVTSIGDYAFFGCYRLVEVYNLSNLNITAGSSDNGYVGYYAKAIYQSIIFMNDDFLFLKEKKGYSLLGYKGKSKSLTLPNNIGEIVYKINHHTFYEDDNIINIIIPRTILKIEEYAFYGCSKLTNVYYEGTIKDWCNIEFENEYSNPMAYASHFYLKNDKNEWEELKELVIPEEVTEIGDYQFYNFGNISKLVIMSKYCYTSKTAFENCNLINEIYLADTDFLENFIDDETNTEKLRKIFEKSQLFVRDETTKSWNLYLSEIYVTMAGHSYFFNFDPSNKLLMIHEKGRYISRDSFFGCENATDITIPKTIQKIEKNTFMSYFKLTNVYYEGTIKDWCNIRFENEYSNPMYHASHFYLKNSNNEWEELNELVIPEGIEKIGAYQFCGFNLKSVVISSTIKSISCNAFRHAKVLWIYNQSEIKIISSSYDNGVIDLLAVNIFDK